LRDGHHLASVVDLLRFGVGSSSFFYRRDLLRFGVDFFSVRRLVFGSVDFVARLLQPPPERLLLMPACCHPRQLPPAPDRSRRRLLPTLRSPACRRLLPTSTAPAGRRWCPIGSGYFGFVSTDWIRESLARSSFELPHTVRLGSCHRLSSSNSRGSAGVEPAWSVSRLMLSRLGSDKKNRAYGFSVCSIWLTSLLSPLTTVQ
jgi:hypothetical protein